jgi:hypothetical protein
MSLRPQLNVLCGRCGKPRGLFHECVSNSRRKQTLKPTVTFGKCPNCRKTITSPLTHVCTPRSDFKRRKKAHEKQQQAKQPGKRRRDSHDYTECSDNDCPRSLCVAYKTGWKAGDEAGYDRGWQRGHEAGFKEGYDKGFPDGIAACPRPHK